MGVLAAGCVGDAAIDEVSTPAVDEGKADSAAELRLRAGDTTVWLAPAFARRVVEGRPQLVLDGRTSRNLTGGLAFVADDPLGSWAQKSARTFEAAYETSAEVAGLIVGGQHFVRNDFAGRSLFAKIVARPRLTGFSGSGVYLVTELLPIVYGGRTMLRLTASTTTKSYQLRVTAAGVAIPDVRRIDDKRFAVDLLVEHVTRLLEGGTLSIKAELGSGWVEKKARLALAVKSAALTTEDPYETWPSPTCKASVRSCLAALPAGSVDLSSCGEAILVNACQSSLGASIDDVSITAGLAQVDQLLAASPGFADDVSALVGAERAVEFTEAVRLTIQDQLQQSFGKWFASAAARDAAVDGVIEAGIDAAYARPMGYVALTRPVAFDLAVARDVAADALLSYLSELDLRETEYGSTLDALVKRARPAHVRDLGFLRDESAYQNAGSDRVLVGSWLSAHVEITINQASGEATRVHFEID